MKSSNEAISIFRAAFEGIAGELPNKDSLLGFVHDLSTVCDSDSFQIQISILDETVTIQKSAELWLDKYKDLIQKSNADDQSKVVIRIDKKVTNKIRIYSYNTFEDDYLRSSLCGQLQTFAEIFKNGYDHVIFHVIDQKVSIYTDYIAITDKEVVWSEMMSRNVLLEKSRQSSIFLTRNQFPLLPGDFNCVNASSIMLAETFRKLRNILSYLYIANSASLIDDKVLLQFDPSVQNEEFLISELCDNNLAFEIYNWIYAEDNSIDRAGIARNIISIHCHNHWDYLKIDDEIVSSIKSNYQIYLKKEIKKYLQLKRDISDFIVSSTLQIQAIAHDMTDGLKNNFIGVMTFFIVSVLTGTVDFRDFKDQKTLGIFAMVCLIFDVSSIIYWIITLCMTNAKWNWIEKSYKGLKNNYCGMLDTEDLNIAFNNDSAYKESKMDLKRIRLVVFAAWSVFIVCMCIFTKYIAILAGN